MSIHFIENTEGFTGKAQAYATTRPRYPDEAINYICSLVPTGAVFADIGAGTGKFTELIARCGYELFAIEPNDDMREQLAITLASFQNVKIINSTAEKTTLQEKSVDVITCSQSLGWLDLNAFRNECKRIGKTNGIVISLFNRTPGDNPPLNSHRYTSEQASEIFFNKPTVLEYANPIHYSRERWLQFKASISDSPIPSDQGYEAHIAEINATFDRGSVDGLLRIDFATRIYIERIELLK